jgi:hypothetical protein
VRADSAAELAVEVVNRVTLAGDLPGGTRFVAVVTTGHILVEVNGTVTASMRPRMTRDDAAELSRSLDLLLHSRHDDGAATLNE